MKQQGRRVNASPLKLIYAAEKNAARQGLCCFELYETGGQTMSNAVIIKDAVKRYGDFTALCGV